MPNIHPHAGSIKSNLKFLDENGRLRAITSRKMI